MTRRIGAPHKLAMIRAASALLAAALLAATPALAQRQPGDYPPSPDSQVQQGVARGELLGPFAFHGQAFPGTVRRYWVYVPHGYDPASPPRALSVFLQDGSADLDNEHGSWFLANQQMLSAMNYANLAADAAGTDGPRYRVAHEWGDGAHSDAHGSAILPDVLRWLWPRAAD